MPSANPITIYFGGSQGSAANGNQIAGSISFPTLQTPQSITNDPYANNGGDYYNYDATDFKYGNYKAGISDTPVPPGSLSLAVTNQNPSLSVVGQSGAAGQIYLTGATNSLADVSALTLDSVNSGTFTAPDGTNYTLTKTNASFADVFVKGNITVTTNASDTAIMANFTPGFGLTLTEAAQIGGFTNFQWMQRVISAPFPSYSALDPSTPLPPGFSDPPDGGYLGKPETADVYPFYYTSAQIVPYAASSNLFGPALPIATNTSLTLFDAPFDHRITSTSQIYSFKSYLIGVEPSGAKKILSQFSWTDNFNGYSSGGITTLLNNFSVLPDPDTGTGGIIITEFPQSVPEPSTWLYFIGGFVSVGYAIRRRYLKTQV